MTISIETAYRLGRASAAETEAACAEAAALRDSRWGRRITYSRKVFIPLTNMCRNSCGYCIFVKAPGDPAAGYLTPDQVLEIARRGEELGCKEALFSLGERPERRYAQARAALAALGHASTLDYLAEACELVLRNTGLVPHVNAGALTEDEVARLKPLCGSMGMMLETTSSRLMRPGMAHHACPDKSPKRRLEALHAAGRQGVPFTTGILIGIGETWEERVDSLVAIDALNRQYGNVQEVIVQNFRAKRGTAMAGWSEPTRDDMIRTLALARLVLDPSISLQAPPNLEERFEDYIDAGINDWGGVSPLTADHINPERAWPALVELGRRTTAKGCRLAERLTVYPRHLELVEGKPRAALVRLVGGDGYSAEQRVH